MEPTQDPTIERLMQGQARFLRPGKTKQIGSLTLMDKARDINTIFDRMNRGETFPAIELKVKLDEIHSALWLLVEQINRDVEVIV